MGNGPTRATPRSMNASRTCAIAAESQHQVIGQNRCCAGARRLRWLTTSSAGFWDPRTRETCDPARLTATRPAPALVWGRKPLFSRVVFRPRRGRARVGRGCGSRPCEQRYYRGSLGVGRAKQPRRNASLYGVRGQVALHSVSAAPHIRRSDHRTSEAPRAEKRPLEVEAGGAETGCAPRAEPGARNSPKPAL